MGTRRTRRINFDRDLDATNFGGAMVLGEPLHVLFGALGRFQFSEPENGMVKMAGLLPDDEVKALERAMSRTQGPVPGDTRTQGERDLDRFMAMVERVMEAAAAVATGRALASFHADLPHRNGRRLG